MRPAQLTPENSLTNRASTSSGVASMRPAQLTPENPCEIRNIERAIPGFNEAGAINAGKHRPHDRPLLVVPDASMRPAQLTPENPARRCCIRRARRCFNEAGAINAGKRLRRVKAVRLEVSLQ